MILMIRYSHYYRVGGPPKVKGFGFEVCLCRTLSPKHGSFWCGGWGLEFGVCRA